MEASYLDVGRDVVTAEYWMSSCYDHEDAIYVVCGWKKVTGGILQLIHCYVQYDEARIKEDVARCGRFSARPFRVGRGCDGTTDACCHALYLDFCVKHGLDPVALHRQAYQAVRESLYRARDYALEQRAAEWQGVNYPTQWGAAEIRGLLTSLYAINNRGLVTILEQIEPCRSLGLCMTSG